MGKRAFIFLTLWVLLLSICLACGSGSTTIAADDNQDDDNEEADNIGANGNIVDHEDIGDYVWSESDVIPIILDGSTITVDSDYGIVDGSTVTITSAGTYRLSGSLDNGQIILDTEDEDIVRLLLNGVNLRCQSNAPIYIKSAEKTVIVLEDNTENYITDGGSYIFEDTDEDEPNAAVFSKDDLSFYGNGSLIVNGNYNDGITSKDGLVIKGGDIYVNSEDDGIRGKDYLVVRGGNITVNSGGDGLKSDNDADTARGYISIESGTLDIDSDGDAVTAETDVIITDGEISLTSGGGSGHSVSSDESAKGIKGLVSILIDNGNISINSADDAVHTNGDLEINNGTFTISSGDDAIHADYDLVINDGSFDITKSYEGIESAAADIIINGGTFNIVSSDDGINVAAGGENPMGASIAQIGSSKAGTYFLYINGGYIVIKSVGDGIDVNGSILMTDGIVIVHGPTSSANGAIDYDSKFSITGGFLVAAGSSGMAQAPSATSTQYSILLSARSSHQAGSIFHIQTSDGQEILTFAPAKVYQSVAFSSPELKSGTTYDIYFGGSSTGTVTDGLYSDGTYTPGSKYASFVISGMVTSIH